MRKINEHRRFDRGERSTKIYTLCGPIRVDGVLADFSGFCEMRFGIRPKDGDKDKVVKKVFWKQVDNWCNQGNELFSALSPMPDAIELWNYIKGYDPRILSATGSTKNAAEEKRVWVRKYLGQDIGNKALLVKAAADKAKYATPNSILIDDRAVSIDPWTAAGGIGILHTSAANTIAQLKKLGL